MIGKAKINILFRNAIPRLYTNFSSNLDIELSKLIGQ